MQECKDLSESIVDLKKAFTFIQPKNEEYNKDEIVVEVLQILYHTFWSQIHEYLVGENTMASEHQIRLHIVYLNENILPFVKKKLEDKRESEFAGKYLELYDDFFALVSFRNLCRFSEYMEFDLPPDKRILTMALENNLLQPIMYTSQQMVLDGSVKRLFKNTPTGYYKSYSDVIIISWILGYNINGDCLKVVGNPKMTTKTINGVGNLLLSQRYAKVFPFYKKYECDPQKMFKIYAPKAGELLLAHCVGIDYSLLCISKETPIDGGRFKYRFYDDITNSKYKNNINMHDSDDLAYNDQWKKRRYTEFDDCEWFTGTVYYYLDFLSRRREENGFDSAEPIKKFRYTKYNPKYKAVFVVTPKLDYETDESTFPQIYETETARMERDRDFDTFQAMEQGLPVIPEGMPFDRKKMQQWTELPLKEEDGGNRSDVCYAALDLPRTGDNNLSLLIFSKCGDLHYLVDAIYQKKPIDEKVGNGTMLDVICDKLIRRNVKHLLVENNVCSNIKEQILDKLNLKNYSCSIDDIYTTENKKDKIFDCQADIQQHIVIPASGIFAMSSDVGKAVFEIITWSSKAKSDDAPDTLAMYVGRFIKNNDFGLATISVFRRR